MQTPDELAGAIARNVRQRRQRMGLTIDLLAGRSNLSKGTVIQVEQARSNPSVATLCRLADALGVGVASLIETGAAPRITVRRAEQSAALWASPGGSKAIFRIGTDPPDIVEVWDWYLEPGDAFDGEAHPPGTTEVLTVLEGELSMTIGDEHVLLSVGDTILFEAVVDHRYANHAQERNRFIMNVMQPMEGPMGGPDTISAAGAGGV
ncbi:MAG: cupin domain-containing protein [Nitriliruptorales bacterium]|nr:cupin domain-containing protein [Nitriliruptorales bacterium]